MGTDKATLEVEGVPLWRRVHDRLSEVAAPILFAPGRVGRLGPLPGAEVDDSIPDAGPLAGLIAGLQASPHAAMAVVAVDMPWCSAPLLSHLARRIAGHDVAVPVDDRGPQVLHAVFARRAASRLHDYLVAGERSLRSALDVLDVLYVPESRWKSFDPSRAFATNLNAPQDL